MRIWKASLLTAILLFLPLTSWAESPPPESNQKLVTFTFDRFPFYQFLRIVAEITDKNVVPIDGTPDQLITFQTVKTPVEEAINSVFKNASRALQREGNVLKVYKAGSAKLEGAPKSHSYKGKLISFDFCEVALDVAVRGFERAVGEKIVLDEHLPFSKKYSIRLIDVPWDQALDILKEDPDSDQYFSWQCSEEQSAHWRGVIYTTNSGKEERLLLGSSSGTWIVDSSYPPGSVESKSDPVVSHESRGSVSLYEANADHPVAEYQWTEHGWRKKN